MKFTLWRSLTARLLAIFVAASLLFGFGSYLGVNWVLDRDYLRTLAGSHMALYTDYMLADLGDPPDPAVAARLAARLPADFQIYGPDVNWSSAADFPQPGKIDFGPPTSSGDRTVFGETLGQAGYAEVDGHRFMRLERGAYSIVIVSPKLTQPPTDANTGPIITAVALIMLALCFLGVQWQVRPLQWIREGAARIERGDLEYRIPEKRSDDLGDLARDINRMADEVSEMLEAKRQLLLAISHELRSPLTRTKVALEFIEDDKVREDICADVNEMEGLIADLLETERLNTRHRKLNLSPVDAWELLRRTVAESFPNQQARFDLRLPDDELICDWDVTRTKLLLKNLLENALRHSPEAAPVTIAASVDDRVNIQIIDRGEGIAEEDLARVTEPFYRADPARSRSTGGFGLGLYLARLVAEAHGGSLHLTSAPGQGTVAHLQLPQQPALPQVDTRSL